MARRGTGLKGAIKQTIKLPKIGTTIKAPKAPKVGTFKTPRVTPFKAPTRYGNGA